jgi:glycosyltransferase involved in cell wall biosynthesis
LLTLNEIDGIDSLYHHIPFNVVDEAFAVDGGSTDGTREFFAEKKLRIVEQISRGRGEAFRIAFQVSASDALIFFSPDGNEDPGDIPKFKSKLEEGYDLVIASRMMNGAHNEEDEQLLRWRKWANQGFTLMANLYWNRGRTYVTDTINGYRAIRRKAFEQLRPDSTGYTIEYQMSIRAMKLGLRIVEFPTFEGTRIGGESYARSLPTGLKMLQTLWAEIWNERNYTF